MDPLSNFQINNFFEKHSPITKQACHDKAVAIAGGGTAQPTPGQGGQSYTVLVRNGTKKLIVQFRGPKYPLDVGLIVAAQETYGELVPGCEYHEGQLDPLHVYTMNHISGEWFLSVRDRLHHPDNAPRLAQTVQDFAVFCASAWYNRPTLMPPSSNTSIQLDYSSQLGRLVKRLPERFRSPIERLMSQLPLLFRRDYPMVINHWDLLENNIHADAQTGHLTGIVDWHGAKVGPFGMQFWGLENLLGFRTERGMRFHAKHLELRRLFWETLYAQIGSMSEDLREAILVARMVGIFLANTDDRDSAPLEEGSRDLAVLESVTLELSDIGLYTPVGLLSI